MPPLVGLNPSLAFSAGAEGGATGGHQERQGAAHETGKVAGRQGSTQRWRAGWRESLSELHPSSAHQR